jgi:hypothetical protein
MFKLLKMFLFLLVVAGCVNNNQIERAREMAEDLLTNISLGNANDKFPEKYFPRSQTVTLMNELKNKCDFANRKGNFINDFYQNGQDYERVSYIYEYYLRCDSIRFIITYNLGKEIELYEFKLEPLEKENDMITKPEKCLKH